MAGEDRRKLHPRVHHQIHHEQRLHHARRLAHVLVQRVVFQHAVSDARIAAQPFGIQRIRVVAADRLHAGNAGHDALAPAAVAGHHVLGARAQTHHKVGLGGNPVHPHRRVKRRFAQIHKVVRHAVVVHHAHAVVHAVRHQPAQRRFVAGRVRAVGDENGQRLRAHAAFVRQVIDQMRNHQILPHPEARNVADDHGNFFTRMRQLLQRRAVNRLVQRTP